MVGQGKEGEGVGKGHLWLDREDFQRLASFAIGAQGARVQSLGRRQLSSM